MKESFSHRKNKFLLSIPAFLIVILCDCFNGLLPINDRIDPNTDDPYEPSFQLVLSPSYLSIDKDNTIYTIDLSTSDKSTVSWQLTSYPMWLIPATKSGDVSGTTQTISFVSDLGSAGFGSSSSYLTFKSGTTTANVNVSAQKTVYPQSFNFTNLNASGKLLYYWSSSSYYTSLYAANKSSWLHCDNDTVTNNYYSNVMDTLCVSVDIRGLSNGVYYDTICLKTSDGKLIPPIPVSLQVSNQANINFIDKWLYLDRVNSTGNIVITNNGNSKTTWKLQHVNGIYLSPDTGNLAPDQIDTIIVSFDSTKFSDSLVQTSFKLTFDTIERSLPVVIKNSQTLFSTVKHKIQEAAFSRQRNLLVTIDSAVLRISNPDELKENKVIALPRKPLCMCVSTDGLKAAVGHDGFVSVIDLENKILEATIPISCVANDITMNSNVIYIFPIGDQWMQLHAINLSKKTECISNGSIYSGGTGRIHPIRNDVYSVTHGLSPQDMEKYTFRSDTVISLGDSPYHGDYSFGNDFWFTEDGSYIISSSSNVFRCSTLVGTDMTYAFKLEQKNLSYFNITWAEHHKQSGFLYVSSGSTSTLFRFSDDYFTVAGTFTVPDQQFFSNGNFVSVRIAPEYVFVNTKGDKIYVISSPESGSGEGSMLGCIEVDKFK